MPLRGPLVGGSVKVNLRSEIGGFGLIVRVGGTHPPSGTVVSVRL